MKKIILFIAFIATFSLNAQTFEPYVIIDPPNPVEGDVIRVGLFEFFIYPCYDFPAFNEQGLSHLFEFNDSNIILTAIPKFIVDTCIPAPVTPAPREYYELGTLSAGTYHLKTQIGSEFLPMPIPDEYLPLLFVYGPTISFEVLGQPQVVDSLNTLWLFILIVVLLSFTWYFLKKQHLT